MIESTQITEESLIKTREITESLSKEFHKSIIGQEDLFLRLYLALLTKGHILVESVPGLGKTRSVNVLSKLLDLSFNRIQFTPDLLPSDILGNLIFNPKSGEYTTNLGPIFGNLILADEINRAPAKVQSALLEAMQEKQVTIGGKTYPLQQPFMVLATQNPIEQEGTFTLPEAQIDRFLFKTIITYPDIEGEIEIMDLVGSEEEATTDSILSVEELTFIQKQVAQVTVSPDIKKYIANIVFATRYPDQYQLEDLKEVISFGASPRASLAFLQVAKALALIQGRSYVIPEDVKQMGHDILRHRIIVSFEAEAEGITSDQIIDKIFNMVIVP